MLEISIFTKKISNEVQGYYLKMKYNQHEKQVVQFTEKKEALLLALLKLDELLKNKNIEIKLFTNIFKDNHEIENVLNKKKYEKVKKIVDSLQIKEVYFIEEVPLELEDLLKIELKNNNDLKIKMQSIETLKDSVILEIVEKEEVPITSLVEVDDKTIITKEFFDFEFNGVCEFNQYKMPKEIPNEFGIGLIVGASGSGKSTLLKKFGEEESIFWENNKAIISQFEDAEEAVEKLTAVGLNSIPSWVKPYHVLSNGEKFRADLSRKLKNNAVIDEFTSVVDRNVAKATSTSISKYIKRNNLKNIVISSCHDDIIDWLEPDWVFDTNEGILYDGKSLRRPSIELQIYETKDYSIWEMFKSHHYLSEDLNKASRKFLAVWKGEIIGFSATLPLPSGTLKNAYRGHRTVILPDYQGLGLGVRFSNAIAEIHINEGKRYYSKTSHIRMGEYRNNSNLWKASSKNKVKRTDMTHAMKGSSWKVDQCKVSYSHEYIGVNIKN